MNEAYSRIYFLKADKCPESKVQNLEIVRYSLIAIVCYFQKNLPLASGTLKDVACLSPVVRDKDWTVGAIKRLATKVPHIISEREVSLVGDQWMIYQAGDIPTDWEDEPRLDMYWSKVFKLKSGIGGPKLSLST